MKEIVAKVCMGVMWVVCFVFIILSFTISCVVCNAEDASKNIVTPPVPRIVSPIAFFRELLETNQQAREKILAEKPIEQRKMLEAKIIEYQSLPADERELRFFMTELRWYLVTVIKSEVTEREQIINQIPTRYQPLIRERLIYWQKLPADIQKDLLEKEYALHLLLRITNATPYARQKIISSLPPQQQSRVTQILNEWNKMSEQRRNTIAENFHKLFELSESEQESALKILPAAERVRMENTLKAFANLPREDKERCIESFKKFSTMSEAQREEFLKNAMRWIEMNPEERKAWRELVRSMQSKRVPELPPLPPGMVQDATAAIHSPNLKPD